MSRGLFTLGPKIAELFRGYVASWTLPQRLEPALLELRDRAAARAYAGMWAADDLEITWVRGRRGASELQDVSPGFRGAAHALAIGKVLLATRPPLRWPSYLRQPRFPEYTPTTITSPGRLYEELADVRAKGYAVDVEEFAPDVCCVAAPVLDGSGRPLAAIAVSVGEKRYRRDVASLIRYVRETARTTSALFTDLDPLRDVVTAIAAGQNP
ncbi:IclR family transcriptional regulator C-terminal domain-containing protein [Lentzea sp. NPDC051838]|uniref:IclR family transcriptional regulator n=1 Tax=Lentzea sp. NPDC051838 TaxID=3154849 RepID=UPI003428A231